MPQWQNFVSVLPQVPSNLLHNSSTAHNSTAAQVTSSLKKKKKKKIPNEHKHQPLSKNLTKVSLEKSFSSMPSDAAH